MGEVCNAAFTLSGTIAWVGKQAQLSAKPVSLGNGWQLIAQAITEGHIKPRGLGALIPSYLHHHHSISIIKTHPHDQQTSQQLLNDGSCPGFALNQYIRSEVRHNSTARDNESHGRPHPGNLPLSSDHGFKSDRSSASTSSSVASMLETLGGLRSSCCGQ